MNIQGSTNVVGLIGNPVSHSFSPSMHNEAFKKLELDYVYAAFDVESSDNYDNNYSYQVTGALFLFNTSLCSFNDFFLFLVEYFMIKT